MSIYILPSFWSIRNCNKNIKYILTKGREGNQEELYLLPDESNNLINHGSAEIVSARGILRKELDLWSKNHPVVSDINPKKVSLSEDMLERVRSLGYLQ